MNTLRFPYSDLDASRPGRTLMPLVPITLSNARGQVEAIGLLDTGAAINVLPYSIGEQLGLDWASQRVPIVLSGNLARVEARGIVLTTTVADFAPVRLAFAWAKTDAPRLILGQTNFFNEFDVCFFRATAQFEISIRSSHL